MGFNGSKWFLKVVWSKDQRVSTTALKTMYSKESDGVGTNNWSISQCRIDENRRDKIKDIMNHTNKKHVTHLSKYERLKMLDFVFGG
jgi:hypothetical protein